MRTLIKIIAAIVIVAIAALIAIPFLIDPNDYKDEISQQVEKATGRQLTIQGDIGLSVFPWVALQLGQLSLSNAEGFEADHFASVNAAQIRIKLMPLLKREVEMDTIVLDGLMLNLETNEVGLTNWDDLTQSVEVEVEAETAQSPGAKEDATQTLAALSIAGVKLTNANILWSDASKDENYQIRNLNLDTDAIVPGDPADLKLNFDLISANPEMRAHINLNTLVSVDIEKQLYAMEKLRVTTMAQSQSLPFSQANITLNADIAANMMREVITLRNFAVDGTVNTLDEQALTFKLASEIDANLGSQQYQLKALALSGNVKDPNMPGGEADFSLTSDITANLDNQTLTMGDLALDIEDLLLNGQVNATELLSETPKFTGNMQIKPFNLRKLLTQMDVELPEMADASTLELFALTTAFEGSTEHFNTSNLKMTLDQSNLTGQFGIRDFSQPAFMFDLVLDQIDADRYLPAAEEKQQDQVASPATAAAGAATEFPLETLREINAKGVFKVGKLKVSGIRTENIVITLDAKDGLVKMSPLAADLYDGKYRGNVNVDARGDKLKLSIDERLQGIQAGPLLTDLTGDAKISGSANANVKLSGEGVDVNTLKSTLNGQGNFSFENGAIKGINIAETLRRARAAMTRQSLPESSAPIATDFSTLAGSFTVKDGVISNNDLSMMSPLLRLNGEGTINLPEEKLDYGLRVAVVGTLEGQGGRGLEELQGLTIPVRISGGFDDPKPSVDLAALFREQATGEVREKAEEKIRERLGDDIGGLLGGALSGSRSSAPVDAPAEDDAEQAEDGEPTEEKAAPSTEEQLKEDVKNKLRSLF